MTCLHGLSELKWERHPTRSGWDLDPDAKTLHAGDAGQDSSSLTRRTGGTTAGLLVWLANAVGAAGRMSLGPRRGGRRRHLVRRNLLLLGCHSCSSFILAVSIT